MNLYFIFKISQKRHSNILTNQNNPKVSSFSEPLTTLEAGVYFRPKSNFLYIQRGECRNPKSQTKEPTKTVGRVTS